MKEYRWLFSVLLVLVLVLTSCALQGIETSPLPVPSPSPSPSPSPAGSPQGSVPASIAAIERAIESIYNQVNPSVVNIQVLQKAQALPPGFPGIPGFPQQPGPSQPFSRALGSGFVWDADGHVVTNNHVVAGADRISVTFYDGTIVSASLVGADPDSDLAVIKVDAPRQLQPVTMADSVQVKVGKMVIAIGNPFGLQGTMTVGFVSGLGRLLPATQSAPGLNYSIPDIIQTDAAINPGNSGGVLLNDAGMVIGVTSAIASQSGTSAGVGFAIPSAIVQKVVPELIKSGRYQHVWLGVAVTSLNPDLDNAMDLKSDQRGALVQSVTPGSPAEKAGLQASQRQATINGDQIKVGGDVIVGFEGQIIKSSDDLITFLARSGSVGQTVSLTVLREGKEMQVQVTLAARPAA